MVRWACEVGATTGDDAVPVGRGGVRHGAAAAPAAACILIPESRRAMTVAGIPAAVQARIGEREWPISPARPSC
jgi:hypothetical protein